MRSYIYLAVLFLPVAVLAFIISAVARRVAVKSMAKRAEDIKVTLNVVS